MTDTPSQLAAYKRLALADLTYVNKAGEAKAEREELCAARDALRALLAPERTLGAVVVDLQDVRAMRIGTFSLQPGHSDILRKLDRAIAALGREGSL